MKTTIIISAILLSVYTGLFAQQVIDSDKMTAAISKSYVNEFSNHYPQAIQALDEVYDTKAYFVNIRLGWLYYLSGDQKKSTGYYRQAIEDAPRSVEARLGLALPLSVMGNWDEIAKLYAEILKLDPNNTLVNYRMSMINYNKKDYSQALSYCLKVVELFPFDFDSNLLLGKIYMSSGKMIEAKVVLYKALQYNPDSKEAKELLKKT